MRVGVKTARRRAWPGRVPEGRPGVDEFIFDIQTHCVDPSGKWRQGADGRRWDYVLNQVFAQRRKCREDGYECYSAEQLVKEVFLDSDTDVAVVSALWGARDSNPTPIEYAAEVRALIETLGGRHRSLIHGGRRRDAEAGVPGGSQPELPDLGAQDAPGLSSAAGGE